MSTPLWIDLDGAHNVRDVGGLRAGARTVRPGVLLRSDQLEDLTPAAADRLVDEVGLRAVIDLRAPEEDPRAGWMDDRAIERLNLPLVDLTRLGTIHRDLKGPARMRAVYGTMLDGAGPALVRILRFLTEEEGRTPALVHCAAGKDRTGITIAVLLAAAGVEHDDIVADYVITGERLVRIQAALARRAFYRTRTGPVATGPDPLDPTPIETVLSTIGESGGAAAYLIAHGAPEADLTRWRDLLLS